MPIERDDHVERMARIEQVLERVQREQQELRDN
jgi:hypothetical protein